MSSPHTIFTPPNRSAGIVALSLLLLAAGCGSSAADLPVPVPTDTSASAPTPTSPPTPATTPPTDPPPTATASPPGTDAPPGTTAPDAAVDAAAIEQLRVDLGANRLAVRTGSDGPADGDFGTVSIFSESGQVTLDDPFPRTFADHVLVNNQILDYAGEPACGDFEVQGDFAIVTEVADVNGSPVVTIEDRRLLVEAFAEGILADLADPRVLPRVGFDCEADEPLDVDAVATIQDRGDTVVITRQMPEGPTLITERGLGDTPPRITTGDGIELVADDITGNLRLTSDGTILVTTSFAGTGAAEPPVAVFAVDVATGERLWQVDVAGIPWPLGDRIVIDGQPSDDGAEEVIVVDATTGAELDRFAFDGEIIGLH